MDEAQLHELNETARANAVIREAMGALRDISPAPEELDEYLTGPATYVFDVKPSDPAWLPVGQYLMQRYADGTGTLAYRAQIGVGAWGPPLSGRRV